MNQPTEPAGREDRMIGLARLADRLSGPMGPHEIIETIVAEVPSAAGMDYADVALVRGAALVSPQVRWPLGPDLVERYASTPLDAHLPTTEAARTGTSVFVESMFDYQAGHPELQAQVTASGFIAAAVVPMRSVDGDVFGVLGLVSRTPVEFDESLIAAIELAGSLCSLALRRTHLGERASALAVLASGLAGAVTSRDVATVVRDMAPAVVGASHTNCWAHDENRTSFAPLVQTSVPAEVASRYPSLPVEAETPIRDALMTDTTIWLRERAEIEARYPALAVDIAEAGYAALAVAPLRDSRGATIGALVLGWDTAVRFDAFLEAMVNTIADLVAQALERAALQASEHELVAALRLSVVGSVDAPPGAAVATRYLPASATVGIGGDWFDVIVTGDERFVVAIGDVSGHGVSAVAAMAESRALINGLIRRREPLGRVFESFATMRRSDALLLSALVLEFDLAARTVTYASAGHPWPMVRRADGSLLVLDQAQQPLLGAAEAVERAATTSFDVGDVLVAFTDGLIERRDEDITTGIDRVASALADSRTPVDVDRVADALLAAVDLHGRTGAVDDAAVVVVACR